VSRAQVNLRLPSTLLDRLAASAQRQGISRNALVLRYVQDGLDLDEDTDRRVSGQLITKRADETAIDKLVREEHEDALHRAGLDPGATSQLVPLGAAGGDQIGQYEKAGPERQSDKPHRHRFERVPQTEAPGRLLGETEATYECVCGKSERRKVT
jgi:hypothetical protein